MTDATKKDPHYEIRAMAIRYFSKEDLEKFDAYTHTLTDRIAELDTGYGKACKLVADMHLAAVGEVKGPNRGVVEDIADLRAERDELAAQLEAVGAGGVGAMHANAKHWHDLYRAECLARKDDAARYGAEIMALESTQPQQIAEPASQWVSVGDFANLLTFHDQAGDCDADGYTVNKDAMRRLAELGVVQSFGFGRYSVSSFGAWLIEAHFEQHPGLPLQTAAEWNKAQPVGATPKDQS